MIGSLYGQSVVELSRQEKARRDGLKGNRAKVITNADLAAVRKTPAVIVVNPDSAEESNPSGVSGADSSGEVVMTPSVAKNGPSLFQDGGSADVPAGSSDTASRLKATNELIDLLTTKMNALMQQANNLDTMTPKDVLQQQIDETNQKLIRVQEQAAKLKAQLEAGKQTSPEKH
jgi:hypothetical protein